MKKLLKWTFILVSLIFLAVTKSQYVVWNELAIIVLLSSAVSFVLGLYLYNLTSERSIVFCALIGYVLYWGISSFDLIIDHIGLNVIEKSVEDGKSLTLSELFDEYMDDLFVMSYLTPLLVIATLLAWHYFIKPITQYIQK